MAHTSDHYRWYTRPNGRKSFPKVMIPIPLLEKFGMSLHVCPGEIFILDSRIAKFWERNCPFGFSACSVLIDKYVLLSLWCLGRKVLDNCIDS